MNQYRDAVPHRLGVNRERTITPLRLVLALALLFLTTARPDQGGPSSFLASTCYAVGDSGGALTATSEFGFLQPPSISPPEETPSKQAASRGSNPKEYAFCGGNPVNRRDPFGLRDPDEDKTTRNGGPRPSTADTYADYKTAWAVAVERANAAPECDFQLEKVLGPRGAGGIQAVGGTLEVFGGVALVGTPEPTCVSKPAGYILLLHGIDAFIAGVRALITGDYTLTVTHRAAAGTATALGASPATAGKVGMGADILLGAGPSLTAAGASFLKGGAKAGVAVTARAEAQAIAATGTRVASGLTEAEVIAIKAARAFAEGDCETAAWKLMDLMPGGCRSPIAGNNLLHEVYLHGGKVYDVTAAQYVKPGVWTAEALRQAGLAEAVEHGVFTPAQHEVFMAVVRVAVAK